MQSFILATLGFKGRIFDHCKFSAEGNLYNSSICGTFPWGNVTEFWCSKGTERIFLKREKCKLHRISHFNTSVGSQDPSSDANRKTDKYFMQQ